MPVDFTGPVEMCGQLILAEVRALEELGDQHDSRTLTRSIADQPFGGGHVVRDVVGHRHLHRCEPRIGSRSHGAEATAHPLLVGEGVDRPPRRFEAIETVGGALAVERGDGHDDHVEQGEGADVAVEWSGARR